MVLAGKRFLITGGNGFLGSHIVNLLQTRGYSDNIFVPHQRDLFDYRNPEDCNYLLNKIKPNIVINCAANQGGIGFHSGKQADLFLDNIQIGCNLMKYSQLSGVTKFVNVIPGCSYPGYLEKDELREEDFWMGDVHDSIFSYGFSKKATIVYGKALQKQYGFNSIHLVLANMYGPGDHYQADRSKALAALIKKIYEAKVNNLPNVEIWGTGKPVRDWLYIKDGAEGVVKATETYESVEPLNIATGVGVTVIELATLIKKSIGYKGKITTNPSKPDGALKKTFSIRKMESALNWIPKISLEEGIKETVEHYKKLYG